MTRSERQIHRMSPLETREFGEIRAIGELLRIVTGPTVREPDRYNLRDLPLA